MAGMGFAPAILSTPGNYLNMRRQKKGMKEYLPVGCNNSSNVIVDNREAIRSGISNFFADSTAIKPNISPTTDHIIFKEGEPLKLHCSGNSSIFFTYPTNRTYYYNNTVLSYTSPIEISKTQDENGTNYHKFYRPNTVFGDTGWYGCSYQPILTIRCNYSDPAISWIYVYVESKTARFVEQASLYKLIRTYGETIVIPCRPTSPEAEVRITQIVNGKNRNDFFTSTFDPKYGFTVLVYVDLPTPATYKCIIAPDQAVSYIVHMRSWVTLPKPIINNTLAHVIKGESLYVKCTINSMGDIEDYDIFWIVAREVSVCHI
nr:uncharacterized protein LOC117225841 [Megalopta genalis]